MAKKKAKPKPKPVMLIRRDYIVLADGTRYEKGESLPPEVAKLVPASFMASAPGTPGESVAIIAHAGEPVTRREDK